MGTKLSWEWSFPTGEIVTASLELPAKVESVLLGPRLVSRSPPGGRRQGHMFPLTQGEARVDFDAESRQCALTQNGAMLPPTRVWSAAASQTNVGLIVGLVVGGVFLLGVFSALAAYGLRKYKADIAMSADDGPLTQTYPSSNGLLIAHYPADFAANPRGENALQLMRGGLRDDSILLMSIGNAVSNDPVELGRIVLKPIEDAFAKKGSYTELSSAPATCLGHPGHSTTGTATLSLEKVNTWSCTFSAHEHGYILFMSVNADFAVDEPLMHRIIDATEVVGDRESGAKNKGTKKAPVTE